MSLTSNSSSTGPKAAAGHEASCILVKSRTTGAGELKENSAYAYLRSLREFSQIQEADLKLFASVCRLATINSGQYISIEGEDEGLNGFIVVSGRLSMLKKSPSGKELIVELLQAEDCFGLVLALAADRLPYQLSARAIQESKVLWVPINHFLQLLKNHPILFKDFAAHLVLCLQSSYRLSRGLAHDRVEVRIAAILTSLALKFANRAPPNRPLTLEFTRQQLADLTGTTPETAIRITRAMQRNGIINIERPGVIRIVNLEALEGIVEDG